MKTLPAAGLEWLLEPDLPAVRYRALTELLALPSTSADVRAVRRQLSDSQEALAIFNAMHPDGYWLAKKNSGKIVGEGVEYGSFNTTHYCLAYLAELGLDRTDARVARAAERYLSLQQADGDFLHHMSCLNAYNVRTFVRLGYRQDPRVQKTITWMLATERADGGYLCDYHEGKYKTKPTKSCIRGAAKALLAFAELPEYWQHPRCVKLVNYFLARQAVFRRDPPTVLVNREGGQIIFPIHYRASLNDILYALSRMGYGRRPELAAAWSLLESKRNADGRYRLDWTPTQALLRAGRRGQPNKWATLYALLARHFAETA